MRQVKKVSDSIINCINIENRIHPVMTIYFDKVNPFKK